MPNRHYLDKNILFKNKSVVMWRPHLIIKHARSSSSHEYFRVGFLLQDFYVVTTDP